MTQTPELYACTKCGGANYGCGCDSLNDCTVPLYSAPPAGQCEPVAWMTYGFNGEQMFWDDYAEACVYCDEDEQPIPLYTAPPTCFSAADMADAQAKAAQVEREECAKLCDCYTVDDDGANDDARRCARAIRGRTA